GQDHTPSRPRYACVRPTQLTRPPHPALHVRDDRDTPLNNERGTARMMLLIWGRRQDIFCKSELNHCDTMARRAICAWRICANCPSGCHRNEPARSECDTNARQFGNPRRPSAERYFEREEET